MPPIAARPRSRLRASALRGTRGFTLVEVAFALMLIGIIVAMAVPRFDRTRMQVDGQDQALRGLLMMAQRLAVTRGYDVLVVFDSAKGLVLVQEDPDADGVRDAGERVTGTLLEGEVVFGRGSAPALRAGATAGLAFTERQGSLPMFVYHRDGSASEVGVLYLTSRRSSGGRFATDSRAFDLQRATGRLLPYRYDGTSWKRET